MSSPQQIIERAGLEYLGEQEMPRGGAPGHVFNAASGSTLMIFGEVTAETLAEKLREHHGQFKRAQLATYNVLRDA